MKPSISILDYEAAERELLLARARRIWQLHAFAFAAAAVTLISMGVLTTGIPWLTYLVLAVWAVVVAMHYRQAVRYGDAHIREQQVRIEWRAGRSREGFLGRA
jgi:hypothetical protein